MKLIVGLGNPGAKYEKTYHNLGFMCIDALCGKNENWKQKGNSLFCQTKINNENVVVLKPQTFMNNSGESVRQIANFFKIKTEDIIVLVDDIDLPLGTVRYREHGSAGTHNGLKSIAMQLNSTEYARIKIGAGRDETMDLADFVLSKIPNDKMKILNDSIKIAVAKIYDLIK